MKIINAKNAPAAIGPYCHAVEADGFIFASGQIPADPTTGNLVEGIENQTKQSLENIIAILKSEGCTLNNVIKSTVFITDMNNFAKVNEVYGKYFAEHKPARSCVQVAKLPKDAMIEIEVIAKKD